MKNSLFSDEGKGLTISQVNALYQQAKEQGRKESADRYFEMFMDWAFNGLIDDSINGKLIEQPKLPYIFGVDSYGTDSFGCAIVKTTRVAVMAASDRGAKQIARNRRDVSYIEREDGSIIKTDEGYDFSTSNYRVGC